MSVNRPSIYFSKRYSPEKVEAIQQPVPNGASQLSNDSQERIEALVQAGLEEVEATLSSENRRFAGADFVKARGRFRQGQESKDTESRETRSAQRFVRKWGFCQFALSR